MADTHFNLGIVQTDNTVFSLSEYIAKDSLSFAYAPRRYQVIRTLDGVDHVAGTGKRLTIRFGFNPLPASTVLTIIGKLLETAALTISYSSGTLLDPDSGINLNMRLSDVSASYLSNCEYRAQDWYQLESVELVEL